jgi:hypothetical protein
MGFFSYKTLDTKKDIVNVYINLSQSKESYKEKGVSSAYIYDWVNDIEYTSNGYEGYGRFLKIGGGFYQKDIFEIIFEMNKDKYETYDRSTVIHDSNKQTIIDESEELDSNRGLKMPIIVENRDNYKNYPNNTVLLNAKSQGFFFGSDEE